MLEADNVEPGDSSTPLTADATSGEQSAPADASTEGAAPAAEASGDTPPVKKAAAKRTAAKKTAAKKTTAKKAPAKRTTKKAAAAPSEPEAAETLLEMPAAEATAPVESASAEAGPETAETPTEPQKPARKTAKKAAAKKAPAKRAAKKTTGAPAAETDQGAPAAETDQGAPAAETDQGAEPAETDRAEDTEAKAGPPTATAPLFQPPDPSKAVVTRRRRSTKAEEAADDAQPSEDEQKPAKKAAQKPAKKAAQKPASKSPQEPAEKPAGDERAEEPRTGQAGEAADRGEGEDEQGGERRRRRRGGRRRRRSGGGDDTDSTESSDSGDQSRGDKDESSGDDEQGEENGSGSRRRRRRRRSGDSSDASPDEPENTVTRVRKGRTAEDEITALSGSTRLEAKKQRRREGREAGRRRAPIVSEAEFLARRESVDRVMVIRQRKDLTQIAVMEDKVLVEHYVSRESQTSLIGNVYLGRVQNVLPSMEAAFIDIGKGRNAVLYAGEVNWDALGAKNGQPRKIESVLKSGQPILVQVTKDPVGHKGARLTSQVSLPGRFLVYVPDGTTSGISRKLPDTERNRLKNLLKEIVPDSAGVIVRTAAEGASEDELTRDVERLTARWSDIEEKSKSGNAPQLLYGEPDLTLKVVRDLFTEDFAKLVIAGDDAWDTVENYVSQVAPDLADRLERYDGERDVFAEYRIDEQIEKALDRKVWLPSGGSLVIDRTEAMTVVDVNTGKFTGSGGNLEETVTKNNLEAAEEIVRQLRLRDIGGIIVVDFIDMVLESNRDLVLRRLVECLGRDRTRHQVAEVTSLGLVQMTRKRIGTGLLEAFSESCEHCQGRGLITHHEPVEPKKKADDEPRRGRRSGRGRGRDDSGSNGDRNDGAKSDGGNNGGGVPSPKDFAAMARHDEESAEPSERRSDEGAGPKSSAEESGKGKAPTSGDGSGDGAVVEAKTPDTAQGGPAAEATADAEARPESGEKPSGRTRSRGGRGRGGRSAQPQGEPQPEKPAQEPAQEQGADAQAQAQTRSEQPQQPSGENVEKTAGDGAASAASPAAETQVETPAETAAETPAETPGEAASATTGSSEPPAPKIVTSVRRRGARRAAGPPPGASTAAPTVVTTSSGPDGASTDGASADGAAPAGESAEGGSTPESEDTEPSGTPHVPVKKRGSRRR